MSDTASTPVVPGLLTGFVTPSVIPLQVAYFATAATLESVTFRVTDAPSGGSVTIELNTASDGSGDGIEATIADGEWFATNTGSVAISPGGALYQRITAESGSAMNLSGNYTYTPGVGVTTYLTDLARVKLDADIAGTDADRDTVLNYLIYSVSKQIQNHIGRTIVSSTATNERISSNGSNIIHTQHYPIIGVTTLTECGTTLVEDTDFELTEDDKIRGQISRIAAGTTGAEAVPMGWVRGTRNIQATYTHGFASVPEDIAWAATALVVQRYYDTAQSGKSWRGLASSGVNPNASTTYDKEFFERDIVPVLQPYRRILC